MRAWLVLAIAGCSFQHGALSPRDDAGQIDAPAMDATPEVSPPSPCIQKWLDGGFQIGDIDDLEEIATTSIERDPFFAPDEQTIYFSSNRAGSLETDVYRATRSSPSGDFGTAAKYASASSDAYDSKMSMTQDGLYLIVATNKNGTNGSQDLLDASRGANTGTFSTPARTFTSAVDTGADELDGFVTLDGLAIYYAVNVNGLQRIAVATRTARDVPFGAGGVIPVLDSGVGDADPTVSADGRVIIYASNRFIAGRGGTNLWYATRSSASGAFGSPQPVPSVNDGSNDGDPWLSLDGCRLYWATDRNGNYDVYASTLQ